MKKKIILLFILLAVLCQFVSCTSETAPDKSTSPNMETESTSAVPEQADTEHLRPIKYFAQQREWDDEILLALCEYSGVVLSDESAKEYPALAKALEQTKNMVVRSAQDQFDNLLATAKEELDLLGEESFVTKSYTLDIQIRRADSVAVSLLSDSSWCTAISMTAVWAERPMIQQRGKF